MVRMVISRSRLLAIVGLAALLVACGNSSMTTTTTTTPPANVSVTVSPSSAALGGSQDQSTQFTATVTGTSNTAVSWTVNNVAGGNSTLGTVDQTGLYTPPVAPTSQAVTVTATSSADTTKSASASVVIVSAGKVTASANPQVAQYSFTSPTDATVTIEFGPDTTYGLQTWAQPVPSGGGTLNMLVAGMRANTTYHMRASVQFANGAQYSDPDQVFTTGGLPAARVPVINVTVPPGPGTAPGIELLDLAQGPNNVITAGAVDLDGNLIWYYDFSSIPNLGQDIPFPIKLLPNGHMKVVIGSVIPNSVVSEVQEIDLAGNVISQLTTAQLNAQLAQMGSPIVSAGFHHDFAVLPNGHTVYLVQDQRNVTLTGDTSPTLVTGDSLVDIDQNGAIAWTWSAFDHLDVNYHPFSFPDWIHANALIYSAADGDLIMSSRSLSWIMKIDYQNGAGSGNIVWKLGPNGDFALQTGGPSDWFYNQHYPNIIEPSTSTTIKLAVWDNGNTRPDPVTGLPCQNSDGSSGGGSCYSRGVLLNVNATSKTVSVSWADDLSPVFADCCGNINVLSNGDVDLGTGGDFVPSPGTQAMEVTQTPAPQVVWQMKLTQQFAYRIVRLPSLYPGVSWAP